MDSASPRDLAISFSAARFASILSNHRDDVTSEVLSSLRRILKGEPWTVNSWGRSCHVTLLMVRVKRGSVYPLARAVAASFQ